VARKINPDFKRVHIPRKNNGNCSRKNKYIACKSRKTTHKFNGKNNIKIMAYMATTQAFKP
jgi:SUMO ligase MMS21 Smc5/6 complex component